MNKKPFIYSLLLLIFCALTGLWFIDRPRPGPDPSSPAEGSGESPQEDENLSSRNLSPPLTASASGGARGNPPADSNALSSKERVESLKDLKGKVDLKNEIRSLLRDHGLASIGVIRAAYDGRPEDKTFPMWLKDSLLDAVGEEYLSGTLGSASEVIAEFGKNEFHLSTLVSELDWKLVSDEKPTQALEELLSGGKQGLALNLCADIVWRVSPRFGYQETIDLIANYDIKSGFPQAVAIRAITAWVKHRGEEATSYFESLPDSSELKTLASYAFGKYARDENEFAVAKSWAQRISDPKMRVRLIKEIRLVEERQ
jgi:hypothetical protein